MKRRYIKHRVYIKIETYNNMFIEQEGKCAICGTHQSILSTALHTDHDHITNSIRGLLCPRCNARLGVFKDNVKLINKKIQEYRKEIETLESMINYLIKDSENTLIRELITTKENNLISDEDAKKIYYFRTKEVKN